MKNKIIILFSITLLIVVVLSGIKDKTELDAKIRIGVSDDMSGFVVDYMIKGTQESSSMEAYFIKDCCSKTSQIALTSDLLDAAIVCVSAAEIFTESNPDYLVYAPITMNTDVVLERKETPVTVGISQNRYYQETIVKDMYGQAVEVVPMIPGALPYALEKGELEAAIIDVTKAIQMQGSFIGISEEKDYISYVLIVHEDFVESEDFSDFIDRYNRAIMELNGNQIVYDTHLASYVDLKTIEKGVHQKWKVKLLSIEAD